MLSHHPPGQTKTQKTEDRRQPDRQSDNNNIDNKNNDVNSNMPETGPSHSFQGTARHETQSAGGCSMFLSPGLETLTSSSRGAESDKTLMNGGE